MKTITLLLFITISVSAQKYVTFEGDAIVEYRTYSENWIANFLKHYNDYSQYCYNDSIKKHTHSAKWNDRCYEQIGNLAFGYSFKLTCNNNSHFEYIHKIPTFKGFGDYLKEKYK